MTGVDILSSQIMDDLFAIFNGVLLVIAIKYNIHTSASFFPDGTVMTSQYLLASCPKVGKPTFLLICINAFVRQQYNIHEVLLEQKLLGAFTRAHRLANQPKNFFLLVALIRAHCLPKWTVKFFCLGALIRAHWLPYLPTNFLQLGALIRAHWFPNWPTNVLGSEALIKAHYFANWPKNCLQLGTLFRAHWPTKWPLNFLQLGGLNRAH